MKKVITEREVIAFAKTGGREFSISPNDLVTPLAVDAAKSRGIVFVTESAKSVSSSKNFLRAGDSIAIGSDHTGFEMKKNVIERLKQKNFVVVDVGTNSNESCDYPDFARLVALKIQKKECNAGILIDATGIPSAITANKFKGIIAATCFNEFSARSSREHNNSNLLVIGARALGEETIYSILEVWLSTPFLGERHAKRLEKIFAIEKQNFKG